MIDGIDKCQNCDTVYPINAFKPVGMVKPSIYNVSRCLAERDTHDGIFRVKTT